MGEYWLQSFSPWLASILLDVAVEDDVVQDPAHDVFIISKNSYNTKPTYGHIAFFYARCVLVVAHCTVWYGIIFEVWVHFVYSVTKCTHGLM